MSAQGAYDALNLSRQLPMGTARYIGLSGAFGALGGDFSTLSNNPAGIGVYRGSEISFTPYIYTNETESNFNSSSVFDSKSGTVIGSVGYVGTFNTLQEDGLVSLNFGFGYNRLNNYFLNTTISSNNVGNSYTDALARMATASGVGPNDFSEFGSPTQSYLAWESYLIDWNGVDGRYESLLLPQTLNNQGGIDNEATLVDMEKSITEQGKIDEWVISFGGNISHKFYFGATLGIHNVDYTYESRYSEDFLDTKINSMPAGNNMFSYHWFDPNGEEVLYSGGGMTYYDYFRTTGTGMNLKIGAIVRPVKGLRLGAALHTPTYYSLTDEYTKEMTPVRMKALDNGVEINSPSSDIGIGVSEYTVQTPMKLMLSAAYTVGGKGLISLDYDIVDYTTMQLADANGVTSEFVGNNQDIRNYFGTASALRIGGEFRLDNNFTLRGGMGIYDSPQNGTNSNSYPIDYFGEMTTYSGGLGYRNSGFYIDLAYQVGNVDRTHYVYGTDLLPDDAKIKSVNSITMSNLVFTLGFKF